MRGPRCALAASALLGACRLPPTPPMAEPLPPLAVQEMAEPAPPAAVVPAAPQDNEPRVTFTAVDQPIRDVLPIIAELTGITLIVDPAVQGNVTIRLQDIPVSRALQLIAQQAGYEVRDADSPSSAPLDSRTVFYLPPANVDRMSAPAIQARFGVSLELAEWIVRSRAVTQPPAGSRR